ncbi:PucR family transcriptional regulator [Aeromicrobium duanguangcaii]|uniref:Helix-turn-helix domain-containing protein n=1 Tax=Aeromicrobium duanguangcaii TaxID=2968086 RepID=A0ABY5KEM7_9ACTN|nr:PucR family transcriptional regulator [Aeromicrobium duanguangcaii]MCD9154454.1 helix-turn-helix domain-containing protein [Aeromicrobium duanguangcaii]MCL3838202.1 helix-turn-helix domain-containing protein [Aeromicrobium duanguangcaii]UUI68488.1 helix-turn-helix domain-containing protein [Aeromicrobium duanguangcaii]
MTDVTAHRRAIAAGLTEGEAALVDTFLVTIAAEIPAYASLDERQLQEVRSIIVWTLHRVLELWAEDGTLTEEDIALFRGVGAVRARDGRPLSAVLRAYRVAAGEFLDQMSDRFRGALAAEDVTSLVRVWFAVLDELSEAIYDGYEVTGRSLGADRESSLRDLLTDLLLGRQSHAGSLAARLRELDAQLPTTFDLVVVGPSRVVDAERAAALVERALEERDDAPTTVASIHTVQDGAGVVLLRSVDTARLAEVVEEHGLHAVRHGRVTARTAPRAYRLAVTALRAAPDLAWSQRGVLDDGDLEVLALVAGHGDADPVRAAEAVLGSLTEDTEALTTLWAVLEADGAAPAAARLHVHPQTVRYRMRRVASLTGRDPRLPWDRYVLQTALLAAPR